MDACIDGELFHLCEEDIQNGMLGLSLIHI